MRKLLPLLRDPYAVAVLSVGAAVAVTRPLHPLEQTPSALFYAAVMVAAWYGGLGPGLLATGLSAVALDYFFLPPVYSLGVGIADGVRLATFLLVAGLISSLNESRRRLERSLREADRHKDEFVAMLAHELRNFLSPMSNVVQVLRAGGSAGAGSARTHEIIDRQLRHMSRLVNDLLDLSRLQRGKLSLARQRVDLAEAVRHAAETVQPYMEARRHRLEVELPGRPVEVCADPTRLEQILVNLFANAAKYSDEGGGIAVAVRRFPGEACVSVRDRGVGLA